MGIYVWGTGCGASELIGQGLAEERISAFVDSYPSGDTFLGKPVLLPEQLDPSRCDLLIITTRHAEAVARRCGELGIPEEKCLFLKNNTVLLDRNRGCAVAKALLGEALVERLIPRQRLVATPAGLAEHRLPERELSNDYVRLATLELLCRRLENVPGAAAELGVYKGYFARCINQLLPERELYLFDSFEGFAEDAGAAEAFQAAHRNTAVDNVLAIMPHPERITVKPGFFPGSLNGLDARFCLVLGDDTVTQNRGEIPDPAQKPVGNPGRPPAAGGNFHSALGVNFHSQNGSRTGDNPGKLLIGVKLQPQAHAKAVPQGRRELTGPGGCAHQSKFGQIQTDGVCAGSLAYDDVNGKVLHCRVQNFFHHPI